MGRKYIMVNVCAEDKHVDKLKALIDTGADVSMIHPKIIEKLNITKIEEIEWFATNGHREYSPSTKLTIKTDEYKVDLYDVIIDDGAFDPDSDEDIILGLDFLQKTGMDISFKY